MTLAAIAVTQPTHVYSDSCSTCVSTCSHGVSEAHEPVVTTPRICEASTQVVRPISWPLHATKPAGPILSQCNIKHKHLLTMAIFTSCLQPIPSILKPPWRQNKTPVRSQGCSASATRIKANGLWNHLSARPVCHYSSLSSGAQCATCRLSVEQVATSHF